MIKINKSMIRLGLTALGVLGIPLTSWLSIKCHDKAKEIDDKKRKAKCYIPAMVSGVATSACIIGSHRISSKEIAALTATASFAVANRNKLEKIIDEAIPNEAKQKESEAKQNAINDNPYVNKKQTVEETGYGRLKCLEGYSGRLFYSSIEKVRLAEAKLNERFKNGEYISMNDFYRYLNIAETHFGYQWGWAPSEDFYPKWYEDNPIGFENTIVEDIDGTPLLCIDLQVYPMEGWQEV